MIGTTKLAEKVAAGKAKLQPAGACSARVCDGDVRHWFEVLPGTRKKFPVQSKMEVLLDDAPAKADLANDS
jgi:hypothetical protein